MTIMHRGMKLIGIGMLAIVCIHPLGAIAFASDAAADWRAIYDTVFRWLNFGILVFLLVKFGKDPAKAFFASQTAEVADGIRQVEAAKKEIDEKIASVKKALHENQTRLTRLKEAIVREGERKRDAVLKDAQLHSAILLEDVDRKIESMALEAKARLKAELIDDAVRLVEERLPDLLTETDNRRFIDRYIETLAAE